MQDIRAWRRPAGAAGAGGDGGSELGGSPLSGVSGSPLQRRGGPGSSPATSAVFSEFPGGGGGGGGLGAAKLTDIFRQSRCLDFAELLQDGFRDFGGNENAPGGGAAAAAAAGSTGGSSSSTAPAPAVIVDRREDDCLTEFLDRASKKVLRAGDIVTRVMVAALLVSETLGRSGSRASAPALRARFAELVAERADPATGSIRIGDIMYDFAAPGGSKGRQPGAGLARHRALLLKAVADFLHIAPCSLRRDEGGATWNTLLVDSEPFVLDVVFDPGALYIQGSGRADEYIRRLREAAAGDDAAAAAGAAAAAAASRRGGGGEGAVGGIGGAGAAAPSMQPNLGGRMLRPSWHVEPWEIEFDRRDRAGRGGFGEVFQGNWAGQSTAIKEVRDASPTDSDVCDFILEISLLSRLSHPNVVRFWRGCVDLRGGHRTLLLVTEWMDRGVLSSLLHDSQEPQVTLGQVHVLAVGIGLGVAYLHEVKILHLDLKSPNVLLNSSWQPKLCDFGLAKLREQTALHTTLRGVSPIWAPPELFDDRSEGVTEKADVYSFGIIVLELASRKLPYADVGQMQLPRVKAKGQLPRFPDDMDRSLADLTRLCLTQRPSGRPSMQDVVERVRQVATAKGIDLQQEQVDMERRGLHFGGLVGSAPNAEQLRRAEAEKRRAEVEVARLRKVLQDEEARVASLEAALFGGTGATGAGTAGAGACAGAGCGAGGTGGPLDEAKIAELCASKTEAVGDARFRCSVCRKLFRGPEFVHKHLREKHLQELLGPPAVAASGAGAGEAPASGSPGAPSHRGGGGGGGGDLYFDADIAEESKALTYTSRLAPGVAAAATGASAPGSAGAAGAASAGVGAGGGGGGGGANGFNQALQDAAEAGDLTRVQQCLQGGGPAALRQADIDGTTPLHLCARLGHAEVVRYLLENSVEVMAADEAGLTPLHFAAQEGHVPVCQLVLEAGASPDADGGSAKRRAPLHLAAANGHQESCRVLLLGKASVNLQDADGESPLHSASRFGERELCELILSFGANPNAADNDGWSPLHEAARWGDGGLVECLLQRGADIAARSNDGESCLHVVPGGYAELEVVEVLLAWRCDVNCKDYDGETPLHVAVKLGDAELSGAFLNSGADANAATLSGATPLDLAKKEEVRWLLRSHKARRGAGAP